MLDTDLKTVHHQPAKQSTICGALKRYFDARNRGTVSASVSFKVVKTTTDVARVTCPLCQKTIRQIVATWPK
jgi:hypothetical protein